MGCRKRLLFVLGFFIAAIPAIAISPAFAELEDGLYHVPDTEPGATYAVSDNGRFFAAYLDDGSPAGAIFLFDTEEGTSEQLYTPGSLVYKLWVNGGAVYFTEHVNPSRTVFGRINDKGEEVIVDYLGYDYAPLFGYDLLFVCYERRGDDITGGYEVIDIAGRGVAGELTEDRKMVSGGAGYARSPVADPDGDGVYFAYEVGDENRVYRYDAEDNTAADTGIKGLPLGFCYGGNSLVVGDGGGIAVYDEDTYEARGVAGGVPVAFFGGGSQVFLSGGAIRVGNLYEGKSSRIDFDLGDTSEVYFYPLSLTRLLFQINSGDGADYIYISSAGNGSFTVESAVERGLVVDCKRRFDSFGDKR